MISYSNQTSFRTHIGEDFIGGVLNWTMLHKPLFCGRGTDSDFYSNQPTGGEQGRLWLYVLNNTQRGNHKKLMYNR